eukprot:1141191-Pelagomonas_calceolata.AAC.7
MHARSDVPYSFPQYWARDDPAAAVAAAAVGAMLVTGRCPRCWARPGVQAHHSCCARGCERMPQGRQAHSLEPCYWSENWPCLVHAAAAAAAAAAVLPVMAEAVAK